MGIFKDAMQGAQQQIAKAAATTRFGQLGVIVRDGQVYHATRLLGPLAGAQAELTDTVKKHRGASAVLVGAASLGAGAVIGLTTKKSAFAYVTFADGTFHESKIKGKGDIQDAQREVAKFNAMARGAQPGE